MFFKREAHEDTKKVKGTFKGVFTTEGTESTEKIEGRM